MLYSVVLMESNTEHWMDQLEVKREASTMFQDFMHIIIVFSAPLDNKNTAQDK